MSLNLQRIACCSDAVRPELALQSLAEILFVPNRNNTRDRLTGVLLISRGRFFQGLEGARQDLDRTLARIRSDPRHRTLPLFGREDTRHLFGRRGRAAARISPPRQRHTDAVIDGCRADSPNTVQAARALLDRQIAA